MDAYGEGDTPMDGEIPVGSFVVQQAGCGKRGVIRQLIFSARPSADVRLASKPVDHEAGVLLSGSSMKFYVGGL